MKRLSILLVVAAALAVAAGGVHAQKRGGELRFAVAAEPPNYDCHRNSSFAFVHPVRPHYNTLLKFDAANYPKVKGDLAESWTVSDDGLTYTFKLRRGVKFHDGSAFTSEDVKASSDRIRMLLASRSAMYTRSQAPRSLGRRFRTRYPSRRPSSQ